MIAADSTQTNSAAVLRPGGSFYYEDRELPVIQSDRDVIVKIIATGLCGSDVHYWQHGRIGRYVVEKPLILGHESTGVVVSCGSKAEGIAVGDRVALEPGVACNTCQACRRGRYNLCRDMRFAATPPIDGTLCTYYRVPAECCFKLPAHISLSQGALVEPLSVAVHACRLAGDMQTKSVIVFGAGPVGLLCCAVACAFGASTVVAVDIVSSRLTVASKYGATHTYQMQDASPEVNAVDLLRAARVEDGADVILDATGAEPCIVCGLHAVAPGGTFIQVGLGRPSVTLPIGQVCDKEVTVKGSFRYGPGDFQTAIGLLDARRVNLDGLVTNEYTFSQVEEAFQNVANRVGIKSVIYGPGVEAEMANSVAA
ncbi:NAD(P)-dependent alcohol dehydrogenase [Aspergillus saccharolyticus JOP 1030-1]|uniref:D-xylulose reductase n=1 Tax=Aspergillus saccharolyticus JOP 1030-1 TaxID=1450539 RepID=A0A318ZB24_9EURO|nr:putative sorbitol/xylitol dehydrogenase [Aspergillus saccharolyticus JOP 1030-1]PYH43667.1 putative sorbitol/xylitol dehydrogenase [Aspergillus saccharolyticus JOP 1030-1]